MAVNSRSSTELLLPKRWSHERDNVSPERNRIWIEPKSKPRKKVPVIYYLSRNGQLEHPHYMEVPLSSSDGLYLRDVIDRLNSLRGTGMAYMFSWSSKRGYKNGYVWHDLSENDLILPANGHDYVLKGSELPTISMSLRMIETPPFETKRSDSNAVSETPGVSTTTRRRNLSWSSFDNPHDQYVVNKCESSRELAAKFAVAADAATQTEEKRRRSNRSAKEKKEEQENKSVELGRGELSPPSITSSEGLDRVSKSRDVDLRGGFHDQTAENESTSGRMKASQVLMQIITCGSSVSVHDLKSAKSKEDQREPARVKSGDKEHRDH